MLKHACILRPLHLLRLAFSAAGGARLRSPLQGSRSKWQLPIKPPLQGEVPPQAAEGCGAWPCHYPFGPPQPLRRGRCFASARKFAPSQGSTGRCKHRPLRSTGQGSARLCRISPSARRQCTPQSAPCGASSSPYRGAFQAAAPRNASPARGGAAAGGGGVRRLAAPISFRITANLPGLAALQGSAVRRLHKTAALPLRSSLRRA